MARGDNLSKPRERSWTKQVLPKTCGIIWNKGSLENKMEWGTLLLREEDVIRLIKNKLLKLLHSNDVHEHLHEEAVFESSQYFSFQLCDFEGFEDMKIDGECHVMSKMK